MFHFITNTNNSEDNRRHQRKNISAIIIFIDFCKAFNTIDRSNAFYIFRAYAIPEKIVMAIAIVYGNATARVISPDGKTDYFKILSGALFT